MLFAHLESQVLSMIADTDRLQIETTVAELESNKDPLIKVSIDSWENKETGSGRHEEKASTNPGFQLRSAQLMILYSSPWGK